MISASNVMGSRPESFQELFREFENYRLHVQSCAIETVQQNLRYTKRFVDLAGSAGVDGLLKELTLKQVQDIVFLYRSNHSAGSSVNFQANVRAFLTFCWCRGYTGSDFSKAVPVMRVRRLSSLPRGIPPEVIPVLYDSIDESIMPGVRDMAMIRLLVTYGVRGIHIRRLKLDDIDWELDRITFPATKRGKIIHQHLTAEVGNSLLNYIENGRPASKHSEIFLKSDDSCSPMTESSDLSGIVSRYLSRNGIKLPEGVPKGTHCFRHAFASRMIGKTPLKNISDMLGHRSLSSSLIYSKVDLETLRDTAQVWPEVENE